MFNYVEKVLHLKDLKELLFKDYEPHYEYLLWATTAPGLFLARKNYEVLETYGDTILKLAGTLLAYNSKKDDKKAGEGDIEHQKVCFVTNFHLFRIGSNAQLQRWMKTKKDTEPKDWDLPLSNTPTIACQCVGKNVADEVESLICALFLSTRCLHRTLSWIASIRLIPLHLTDMLSKFTPGTDYTFRLYKPLALYDMKVTDYVSQLFDKYFAVENDVDEGFKKMIRNQLAMKDVGELGEVYEYCRFLKGEYLIKRAQEILQYL